MSHAENQYFLCSLNHKEDGCPGYDDLSIIRADTLPAFHGSMWWPNSEGMQVDFSVGTFTCRLKDTSQAQR